MEIESLLKESKWNILTELSEQPMSPTDLASRTGTTIANISTQLRLLEALDFVEKKSLNNVSKGEPRKIYSLKKEFGYLILGTKQVIGKKMFVDKNSLLFLKMQMISDNNAPSVFTKFYCDHESLLKHTHSLGYLGIRGDELEVVIICHTPERLYYLNEQRIIWDNKEYKVKAHIHSKEGFKEGIGKKDEYFTILLKRVFTIKDTENFIMNLKKGGNNNE